MTYTESAVTFECVGARLIGILSAPSVGLAATRTGVVIVVGGPQYRVGSHRQFVQLARALASQGHVVLRFDYRGMGDAEGAQRSFEAVNSDIAAAIDTLKMQAPGIDHLVLFGLCDGASAALLYLHATNDRRVTGLCVLNPWVRSNDSLARTHLKHYYLNRLTDRAFWRKLLSGGIGLNSLTDLAGTVRRSITGNQGDLISSSLPFQQAMALAWGRFNGSILLVLSGNDLTAREFDDYSKSSSEWLDALARDGVQRVELANADHTLSQRASQSKFEETFATWLTRKRCGVDVVACVPQGN